MGGETVFSGEDFVTSDRLTPTQSKAKCQEAFAQFARFGIGPREIAWIGGIGDPRIKPGQMDELAFVPYNCTDGVPRLLVRLNAGHGLLHLDPRWMQFPEQTQVETSWGRPNDPVPNK